ncbi:MAG: hypothetical protein SWZ49_27210 [Cyanobacteriota bacterium]|nr:hypothetical protein [Cyanobacteriota bacterium]
MGRWTPLILMAGGLAILLGTLLGINFPMDGRNAEVRGNRRESQVLPANINVNSTATNGTNESSEEAGSQNNVAQNNNSTNSRTIQSAPTTTAQSSGSGSNAQSSSSSNNQSQTSGNRAPIRALW